MISSGTSKLTIRVRGVPFRLCKASECAEVHDTGGLDQTLDGRRVIFPARLYAESHQAASAMMDTGCQSVWLNVIQGPGDAPWHEADPAGSRQP